MPPRGIHTKSQCILTINRGHIMFNSKDSTWFGRGGECGMGRGGVWYGRGRSVVWRSCEGSVRVCVIGMCEGVRVCV